MSTPGRVGPLILTFPAHWWSKRIWTPKRIETSLSLFSWSTPQWLLLYSCGWKEERLLYMLSLCRCCCCFRFPFLRSLVCSSVSALQFVQYSYTLVDSDLKQGMARAHTVDVPLKFQNVYSEINSCGTPTSPPPTNLTF